MHTVQLDTFMFDTLKKDIIDIFYKRDGYALNIESGHGWDAE
jgi:hypothetical protein